MNRFALTLLLAIAVLAVPGAEALKPAARNAAVSLLVGTWRLVRYVDTPEGKPPVYAFGEHPIGQFVFTADGSVAINIMRNPPDPAAATSDIDPDACVPAWYCSYFGRYEIDPAGASWTTHVEGSNIPSYLGTDQKRAFRLDGDRLTINETYQADGATLRAERVLVRLR